MSHLLKVVLFSALCVTALFIGKSLADPPLYQHSCLTYDCDEHPIGECTFYDNAPFLTCLSNPMYQCNLTGTAQTCFGSKPDDTPCAEAFSKCTAGP
jgi:hypothetical protein